jgi:hypothetical protein
VGRSIFLVGGAGRISKAEPERESQQIAGPDKIEAASLKTFSAV